MKRTPVLLSLCLGAALAAAPLAGAAEDPAAVFKAHCAKCHGETGMADTPAAKTLKVPPLKGDAKVAAMSVADIVAAVKANEKHKTFASKLSAEQIEAGATEAKTLAGSK